MDMDLDVSFEINPKLQALCDILDGLKSQTSKPNSKNKRSKGSPRKAEVPSINEAAQMILNGGSTAKKKLLLVAVKTPRICMDLQKFLIAKYQRKNHRNFYEEKLRFILSTHREFFKR